MLTPKLAIRGTNPAKFAAAGVKGITVWRDTLAGRDIARHVHRALDMAALCSNDPVCAHHSPARPDHQPLHGAACHGCLLIAETSCEQRNDFLDRSVVVRTVEHLGCEFFPPVP